MLNELVVEDLGPLERAEITLDPGSSALTGETGAGKTLLVAAVGLLLGDRADKQMIREGASEARVEGRFVIPADDPAVAVLVESGFVEAPASSDEVELIVSRSVTASGSRARINGRLAPVAVLAELGPGLVEIAGQHAHQRLASRTEQRRMLDAFIGDEAITLAREVAEQVRTAARARRTLDELVAGERERARELDLLRFEIAEIEGASLEPGELERLTGDARRLEHAESLASGMNSVSGALHGEGGAAETVSSAAATLGALVDHDPELRPLLERLDGAAHEITDVAQELRARVPEPDPLTLESIRDRLGVLAKLRRKFGDSEADILEHLERARARAAELDDATTGIADARRELGVAESAALAAAERLSGSRRAAAPRLGAAVEGLVSELALQGSRFEVSLQEQELGEGGLESVEFLVATGTGETPRPLTKIASGGELSRIALALHLLVSDSQAGTLVFDEVDAGVGGEAAQAVGRALGNLAQDSGAQVLVVTHLPQVAAFADAHYRVSRTEGDRRGVAVERVDGDERVAELSRMLAGLPKSERAREHAQELLELAAAGVRR